MMHAIPWAQPGYYYPRMQPMQQQQQQQQNATLLERRRLMQQQLQQQQVPQQQQQQQQLYQPFQQLQYEAEWQLRNLQVQMDERDREREREAVMTITMASNTTCNASPSTKDKMSLSFLLNHDDKDKKDAKDSVCQAVEKHVLTIMPVSTHSYPVDAVSPSQMPLSIQTTITPQQQAVRHPMLSPTAVVGATGGSGPVLTPITARSTPLVTPRRAFQGKKLFKQFWTEEEDRLLTEIVTKYRPRSWDKLAAEFMPTRTGGQLRARWEYVILRRGQQRQFTAEEDRIILQTYAKVGTSWAQIADKLVNRKDQEVKHRFRKLQRKIKYANGKNEGDNGSMESDEDGEHSSDH